MTRSLLEAWPARRRVAGALLLPIVATWFVVVGGSTQATPSTGWYALVAIAAALGSGVLASYVPVAGRKLDLGCTPCATVAAFTVVGATFALRGYGADIAGPLFASALLLFGLTQRMNQPATCASPGVEPRPDRSGRDTLSGPRSG